jgi:GntR family transcriptional regulator
MATIITGSGATKPERIIRELSVQIDSGRFKPGDQLPPLPELCTRFEVSPFTARTALKQLEADGR